MVCVGGYINHGWNAVKAFENGGGTRPLAAGLNAKCSI